MTPSLPVKSYRGQFFTVSEKVHTVMVSLLASRNLDKSETGEPYALEPSAGEGHLVQALHNAGYCHIDAVEIDKDLPWIVQSATADSISLHRGDFFGFSADKEESYDVVFGNPPYVAWKKVEQETRESAGDVKARYADKANLYYLFMDRCIDLLADKGEMVLIIPKEWLYATSANPLREKMFAQGNITHLIDCKEEKLFPDADVPSLVIVRFEKGNPESGKVSFADGLDNAVRGSYVTKSIASSAGRWLLLDEALASKIASYGKLRDYLSVKVGIVSGADKRFRVADTGKPADYFESETVKAYLTTKGMEDFIDVNAYTDFTAIPKNTQDYLLSQKDALLKRQIRAFDEHNWWQYGVIRNRKAMESGTAWISVEGRTRRSKPFTLHKESMLYSGGILGLFAIVDNLDMERTTDYLNSDEFAEILTAMFLINNGKMSLQPSTLMDAPFPDLTSSDR